MGCYVYSRTTTSTWRVACASYGRERGYNLDIQNPNAVGITHEDPDELLARFEKESAAAAVLREQLRDVLAAALLREVGE